MPQTVQFSRQTVHFKYSPYMIVTQSAEKDEILVKFILLDYGK